MSEEIKQLNFDSILIVTYGRSGSTLLQGVLNSHEEILVRGENNNFCFGLFESYKALKKTRLNRRGLGPESPFFGSVYLDEIYFLSMAKKTVKNLLFGDQIGNEKIKCYGFKEIRYERNQNTIDEYLTFLKQIFPNPAFVFNTRNKDAVLNSREKIQWKGNRTIESLQQTEVAFNDFAQKNPDCSFHITYEDVVAKSERLNHLYLFLGIPYSEEKINSILAYKHSKNLAQDEVSKLKSHERKIDKKTEDFRIVSFEDRHLASIENDLFKMKQKLKKSEDSKVTGLFNWLYKFTKP